MQPTPFECTEAARKVGFDLRRMEASESLPRAGVTLRTTARKSAGSGFNPQAGRPFSCRSSVSALQLATLPPFRAHFPLWSQK
jgi:hypothetical protein